MFDIPADGIPYVSIPERVLEALKHDRGIDDNVIAHVSIPERVLEALKLEKDYFSKRDKNPKFQSLKGF